MTRFEGKQEEGGEDVRRGYFNGFLTGGLLGAIVMMLVAPQFKKERKSLMRDTKKAGRRANRVIRGVKTIARDWMK